MHIVDEIVLEDEEGWERGDVEMVNHALSQVVEVAQLSRRWGTSRRRK
jgi:hypothetical protein